jgi:hypothetical protein
MSQGPLPAHQPPSASLARTPGPPRFIFGEVRQRLTVKPLRASNSSSSSTVNVVRGQTRTPTPQHPPLDWISAKQLASGILPFILPPDAAPGLSFPISLTHSALIASLSGFDTWSRPPNRSFILDEKNTALTFKLYNTFILNHVATAGCRLAGR